MNKDNKKIIEEFGDAFLNNGARSLRPDRYQDQKMLLIRKFIIRKLEEKDKEWKRRRDKIKLNK